MPPGTDRHRRQPTTADGVVNAFLAEEAALLLDLEDVYWAKQGRTSVDLAVGLIGLGGLTVAGMPLRPHAAKALHR